MKKKVIAIHLRDDYSGSPRILKEVVSCLSDSYGIEIWAGGESNGILSDNCSNVKRYFYRWSTNKYLKLLNYLFSQTVLFFKVILISKQKVDLIYINTLLPFGAALAAKLRNISVIYHVHEISIEPKPLMQFLVYVASITSDEVLYVSNYHNSLKLVKNRKGITVYNSLPKNFTNIAYQAAYHPIINGKFVVLMVTSLRDYKGVYEFLEVASQLEKSTASISFKLVLSSTEKEVLQFKSCTPVPKNVEIYSQQDDLSFFYQNASLLLNLSRPDQWVETFGLTLLEAMAYGVPVIAPPIGGPTEIVIEGENGFLISCYDVPAIASKIQSLSLNSELCAQLSTKARQTSQQFSPDVFSKAVFDVVTNTLGESKE